MIPVEDMLAAIVILFSNLYGGEHNHKRYDFVTAAFGWIAAITLTVLMAVLLAGWYYPEVKSTLQPILAKVFAFSFIAALSRDYEKLLKPFADRFLQRK